MNKISFIGSGNVSTHLSHALSSAGFKISSISSRDPLHAKELASSLNSTHCKILDIKLDTDLIIISVSDDAIEEVVSQIPKEIKSVVHTSGAVSIDIFENKFENFGVFYPLQSFSKKRELEMQNIPFLIEASDDLFASVLSEIAKKISNRVEFMDSSSRKHLHLAAVFANNFVNLMATEAYGILEDQNIDGSLIRPLLLETVLRLDGNHPKEMQTGPAKRNDIEVLKKHEDLLKSNPKLQSLYRQLSQQIMKGNNGSEL